MEQIRLGLMQDLNIEEYLNPNISWKEMQRIRLSQESNK